MHRRVSGVSGYRYLHKLILAKPMRNDLDATVQRKRFSIMRLGIFSEGVCCVN
ncbi:hypothetical protein D3C80_2136400 [compost metagenome]